MIVHTNDPKFIFIHIPKTAGSSMGLMLDEKFGKENLKNFGLNQHITAKNLQLFFNNNSLNWEDYFKFSFVRNPWSRVVSYYEYQFKEKYTFAEFCKKSRDTQLAYLVNEKKDFIVDFIGRFENYEYDCQHILKCLGFGECKVKHINSTRHRSYKRYYDATMKKDVAKNYMDDIIHFGYEYNH